MEMEAEREEKSIKAEREEESSMMEGCSPERRHYYLARRTLVNMLADRGYVAEAQPLADADPCTPRLTAHRASDFSRKIVAIFCEAHQTKKQDALAILSQIVNKETVDKVILVMPSRMSFHAQKVLDAYPVQVETLMIFDLLPKFNKDEPLMNKQTRETESNTKGEEKSRKRQSTKAEREERKRQKEMENKAKREERSRKRQFTKAEREESKRQKVAEQRRYNYYSARRTLMEMFSDRGYIVPNMDAELALSLADFHVAFGDHPQASSLSLTAHRASDSSRKIVAVFCEDYQTKKEDAVGIVSKMAKKEMVERVILVMQSKIDVDAQKVLDESPVKVETFMITELRFNILRKLSKLEVEIFSVEDKDKVLKKMDPLHESELFAKYYGLEKGQVLKMCYDLGDEFTHEEEERIHYFRIV